MFLAMNHFRVAPDRCADFERAWRERDSYLDDVPGFVSFHLLRGDEEDGAVWYASHTVWRDAASFRAWVDSDAFRKAHAQGKLTGILTGPPQLRCWTSVLG
ncbi:MAG: antibiotic biosynthesis monooxygenase [Deltaproteobacteria bacterium]|nr:MAG: antibiotic biosynthesis monooxygenase [Deltaproteobacteria bacterium]